MDLEEAMVLTGKFGVIFGVANRRSIAWAIAQALDRAGARLALTYQNDRLGDNVRELATQLKDPLLLPCDVEQESQIEAVFQELKKEFGALDILIHSIAYAPREDLAGAFYLTSREGYRIAQEVSAYSLIALARRAAPLMAGRGGSIVTMTYLGSERVMPGYNVMGVAKAALESSVRYLAHELGPRGIRVNAISAGPIKTLAASGVGGISKMIQHVAQHAPLRRSTDPKEVADTALFLCSHLARGITGAVIFVDSGYHVLGVTGLGPEEAA
jgi:enoyl-[acyl-carrier protein] reductase I